MTDPTIELPPLPTPCCAYQVDGAMRSIKGDYYTPMATQDYARAAILADRARVAQRELSREEILSLADSYLCPAGIADYTNRAVIAFARAVLAAGGRHG